MRILRRTLPTVLAALATMVLGLTPARALDDGGGRSVFALGAGNRALALGGAFGAVVDTGLIGLRLGNHSFVDTGLIGLGRLGPSLAPGGEQIQGAAYDRRESNPLIPAQPTNFAGMVDSQALDPEAARAITHHVHRQQAPRAKP